jgi:hypothetical protein
MVDLPAHISLSVENMEEKLVPDVCLSEREFGRMLDINDSLFAIDPATGGEVLTIDTQSLDINLPVRHSVHKNANIESEALADGITTASWVQSRNVHDDVFMSEVDFAKMLSTPADGKTSAQKEYCSQLLRQLEQASDDEDAGIVEDCGINDSVTLGPLLSARLE